ncbi:calcium-binding protein, partial [Aquabacterium sp.]|uniref:calcium-binding protein n=1 Tax=Aquabacterium sp. TaxID=1872578 RepID=UPI0019BFD7DD
MATIQVGYRQIGNINGQIFNHTYLVYTPDSGPQKIIAGGPEKGANVIAGQLGLTLFGGKLGVGENEYKAGIGLEDFPAAGKTHHMELVASGGDLSGDWQRIRDAMKQINDEGYAYRPVDQNSNSAVNEMLSRAGLPLPPRQFPPSDNYAPGSEAPLVPFPYEDPMHNQHWEPSFDRRGNGSYRNGARTRPPISRDPLAIDIDGNGANTVGISANPILFDHNADGVKTGTGWVAGDDAWLVLDRNGNGLIDSGRELFGADTVLTGTPGVDAVYANTGFQALATLDTNHDNLFNAADAAFTQVRVWQDINQDGVSQSNELFSLSDKNIASIGLNASTTTIDLGNGNVVSGTSVVTRTNGTTTIAGAVGVATDTTAANINLTSNPFFRSFTNTVALSAAAEALPEMRGSGWVRDLREAMSLGTPQSAVLIAKVQAFSTATTKEAQMALVDDLLRLWAETNQTLLMAPASDQHRLFVVNGDAATSEKLRTVIPVLEVFNGMNVADAGMQAPTIATGIDGNPVTTYNIFANQAPVLLSAYDSFRESVYAALAVQTRLKPYLDSIVLRLDDSVLHYDPSAAVAMVHGKSTRDALNDLIDLRKYAGDSLAGIGWQPGATIADILNATAITPDIQSLLLANQITYLGSPGVLTYTTSDASGWTVVGNALNNTIVSPQGDDYLYGGAGDDNITDSGSGTNVLRGDDGNDTISFSFSASNAIEGGAGNDVIKMDTLGWGSAVHTNIF